MDDSKATEQYGLADPLMLDRIDHLFQCGVGDYIDLPQIVVVGDQSSGKSSVLEGLIRKPLPRDSQLCTRFATMLVFRRSKVPSISVSIIPDKKATAMHRAEVSSWKKASIETLDDSTFSDIMKEAQQVMGLAESTDVFTFKPTFSNDVLRIEICGPDREHFSVIDVPGIFKNTFSGPTNKNDIALVREMVLGYMKNPRSVMLTVVPANVDVATQEILELAHDVDPDCARTLGVLTKPDLVDAGAESRVVDIVEGRVRKTQLGWHVVRNPGQKELNDGTTDRDMLEKTYFSTHESWKNVDPGSLGIESLRTRLRDILSSLTRSEFPKVKIEISKRLTATEARLRGLGKQRDTREAQTAFLVETAMTFQNYVNQALDAKYAGDSIFDQQPELRIASKIMQRMYDFDADMARLGQQYMFLKRGNGNGGYEDYEDEDEDEDEGSDEDDNADDAYVDEGQYDGYQSQKDESNGRGESKTDGASNGNNFIHGIDGYRVRHERDISPIEDLLPDYEPMAQREKLGVHKWLKKIYVDSRGFELSTFPPAILATAMKQQSRKWPGIATGYVADVMVVIHRFVTLVIQHISPDKHVRDGVLDAIFDVLTTRYKQALQHLAFLLTVERDGTPLTTNHYYNASVEKSRMNNRLVNVPIVNPEAKPHEHIVRVADLKQQENMSNIDHTIREIHDQLQAYYKVTRKRFVDNVSKQVVDHYLVNGKDSPLRCLTPAFIGTLSSEQIESIAGEAPHVRRLRTDLTKEVESLKAAKQNLSRS